MFFSLNNFS